MSIVVGDTITFTYHGRYRHVQVRQIIATQHTTLFRCWVDNERKEKIFKIEKMVNIQKKKVGWFQSLFM